MKIGDVATKFMLSESQVKTLESCIETYAQSGGKALLYRNISCAVMSIFSASPWCAAKGVLHMKAKMMITDSLGKEQEPTKLELKADALTEFILRYLVTLESIRLYTNQWLLDETEWKDKCMETLTIDDVIVRAVHGAGFVLPELRQKDLKRIVLAEKQNLANEIEEGKRLLNRRHQPSAMRLIKDLESAISYSSGYLQTLFWLEPTIKVPGSEKYMEDIVANIRIHIKSIKVEKERLAGVKL